MEYLIGGILTQRQEVIDYILLGLLTRSLEARQAYFIEKYGSLIMEQFQQAIRSITKMDTMITQLEALNLLLRQNTMLTTDLFDKQTVNDSLKTLDWLLQNGMALKLAERGILKNPRKIGKKDRSSQSDALFAVLATLPTLLVEASSVLETVKPQLLGEEKVYNLASENGMYFANGILVSNCDGLRYLALYLRYGLVKERKPIKNPIRFNQYGL